MGRYAVELAPTAFASLRRVRDRKVTIEIAGVIDTLAEHPERRGKRLEAPLDGLRSARAARGRYRILYEIDEATKAVSVLLVGERRPGQEEDIYARAARLLAIVRRPG